MKFGHIADVHLGLRLYSGAWTELRRDDIFAVYLDHCHQLADQGIDFLLVAGDLFHSDRARELDRSNARAGLQLFREKNIPVFAIYGNHDRPDHRDGLSLLDELEELGYLHLLDHHGEGLSLPDQRVNIWGTPWSGAATARQLAGIDLDWFESDAFNILLAHPGLDGLTPVNFPEYVSYDVWRRFFGVVDYVALGHIHKPFNDGWRFMPGSIETTKRDEWAYHQSAGPLVVKVGSDNIISDVKVLSSIYRRPYVVVDLNLDEPLIIPDHQSDGGARPVVSVKVSGQRTDDTPAKIDKVRQGYAEQYPSSYIQIIDATTAKAAELEPIAYQDRRHIEQEVFDRLLPESLARVASQIMDAVLEGEYGKAAEIITHAF